MEHQERKLLLRSGYGSAFNTITIEKDRLEKRAVTKYGQQKLQFEQQAYKVFQDVVPCFPLATLFEATETTLVFQYYSDSKPFWTVYTTLKEEDQKNLLERIFQYLDSLHKIKKVVSKDMYLKLLLSEMVEKVRTRYQEIQTILDHNHFDSVNGQKCLSFEECVRKVEEKTIEFVEMKQDFELTFIHGDPQFSNILYNETTKDFVFIDPRGYFGTETIFGIPEYDTAKVLFALSGYDLFDSKEETPIQIQNADIRIPDFTLDKGYSTLYPHLNFILVSIWLANAHCFSHNPSKLLVSHAIARLLATKLL